MLNNFEKLIYCIENHFDKNNPSQIQFFWFFWYLFVWLKSCGDILINLYSHFALLNLSYSYSYKLENLLHKNEVSYRINQCLSVSTK